MPNSRGLTGIVRVLSLAVALNVGNFFLLCCFLLASTGLPIKVVFLLCRCFSTSQQKGGAVPSCSPKETYLLQIRGPEMEQNKQECEQLLSV